MEIGEGVGMKNFARNYKQRVRQNWVGVTISTGARGVAILYWGLSGNSSWIVQVENLVAFLCPFLTNMCY